MGRIESLMEKLALDNAMGAIDSFCVPHKGGWRSRLEDEIVEANVWVDEAIEYLTLSGRLEFHHKRKDWFRVKAATQLS